MSLALYTAQGLRWKKVAGLAHNAAQRLSWKKEAGLGSHPVAQGLNLKKVAELALHTHTHTHTHTHRYSRTPGLLVEESRARITRSRYTRRE